MITKDDLDRAAAELAEAEAELADLGPGRRFGWLTGREAGQVRAARRGRVEQAAERLEVLTAQHAAEQADLADRPAREKGAAKLIAGAGKALDDSAARVAVAAEAAQAALVELVDAAAAHDALVHQYGAELAAHGLRLDDGSGVDHATGGKRGAVRIKGRWRLGVDPGTLLVHVAYRVAEARLGRVHGLTSTFRWWSGRPALDRRADDLLDAVKPVKAGAVRELPKPRIGRVQGAPVVFRDDYEREQAERRNREAYASYKFTLGDLNRSYAEHRGRRVT